MSSAVTASPVDAFSAAVRLLSDTNVTLREDVHDFAIDAMTPEISVEPHDEDALAAVLSEAREAGLAVIAVGGGQHLSVGNVPEAYDVALSLARMDGIVAFEPDDLTVTVQPGVRLAELQTQLAAHNQFLPLDPPCGLAATIGGVLAVNASGPWRHAHGTARDWLIGMRIVHASGAISKTGGRVVKNVAGYDMGKLYIGSLGTLGVISEATFKLAPLPPVQTTVSIGCDTAHAAAVIAFAAHDAGLATQAMELLSPPASHAVLRDARWSLLVRVAGTPGAVERTLSELRALSLGMSARMEERPAAAWDAWRVTFAPATLSLRISVLPSETAESIEVLDRRFTGAAAMLSATVSAGLIRANLDPQRVRPLTLIDHAREAAVRRNGALFIDAASPLLKRQYDVFGPLRPDIAIMRRLKEQLDPQRTLAPGRFFGRI